MCHWFSASGVSSKLEMLGVPKKDMKVIDLNLMKDFLEDTDAVGCEQG